MGSATDAELLARAVRNPGRFCLGPTTLSGSFPFGGVSLGFSASARARWDIQYERRYDPSTRALVEIGRGVENLAVHALNYDWDEDLVPAIFTQTTPSSGLADPSPPESRVEGATVPRLVPATAPVLFVSDDTQGKCVFIRRPLITLDMSDPFIQFAIARKHMLPVEIEPTTPLGLKPFQICRFANMDLT